MNKWEEDLRSKLSSYSPEPPAGVWKKMEGELSKPQKAEVSSADEPKRSKRVRRLLFVLSPVAAAACLVLALLPLRQAQGPVASKELPSAFADGEKLNNSKPVASETDVADIEQQENMALAQSVPNRTRLKANASVSNRVDYEDARGGGREETNAPMAVASFMASGVDSAEGNGDSTVNALRKNEDAVMYIAKSNSSSDIPVSVTHREHNDKRLSFAFSMQGSPTADELLAGSYSNTLSATSTMNSSNVGKGESAVEVSKPGEEMPMPDDGGITKPGDAYTSVLLNNLRNEVATETRHRLPLSFALTVAYPLSKKISFDASLVYTHASSDFRSGSESDFYFTKQKLDYLGPALHLGWSFLDTRPVTAYVRAGMTLQGCISGNQKTNYVVSGRTSSDEVEVGVGKGLWQASADASVGVQFNIIPSLGIYVEPGVSRYVDDGSSLSTYAHEHQTAFSLKAGLRFTLPRK